MMLVYISSLHKKKAMNISEKFYDSFSLKLLTDFAYGNLRVINAIKYVLNNIYDSNKTVLDIGCGIGWTSYEIAKNFPEAKVDALDLSKSSIEIAKKLFNLSNLRYYYLDVTSKGFQNLNRKYDIIVLVDVFEHILDSERETFLQSLANYLTEEGEVILTYPSPEQQQWLCKNSPLTMQPIDEIIDFNIILDTGRVLRSNIKKFEYKDIWYTNDYIYCVYQKKIIFNKRPVIKREIKILNFKERKKLLHLNGLYKNLDWKIVARLRRNDYPEKHNLNAFNKLFHCCPVKNSRMTTGSHRTNY
jgi:2-polyprenyl-3-methyl-5-hydroxy-6-metoxy-1,4-benzoquinol methylase